MCGDKTYLACICRACASSQSSSAHAICRTRHSSRLSSGGGLRGVWAWLHHCFVAEGLESLACTATLDRRVYIYTHTCINTRTACMYKQNVRVHLHRQANTCVHLHTHVRTCVYIHIHTQTDGQVFVAHTMYMHIYIYIIYVYTHIQISCIIYLFVHSRLLPVLSF